MTHRLNRAGLCERCAHARIVSTPRSRFWRCGLSDTDPAFPRYPRLPVLACAGFTPGEPDTGVEPDVEPDEPA